MGRLRTVTRNKSIDLAKSRTPPCHADPWGRRVCLGRPGDVRHNRCRDSCVSRAVFTIATGSSRCVAQCPLRRPDVEDSVLDHHAFPTHWRRRWRGDRVRCACIFAALGTKITVIEGRDSRGFSMRDVEGLRLGPSDGRIRLGTRSARLTETRRLPSSAQKSGAELRVDKCCIQPDAPGTPRPGPRSGQRRWTRRSDSVNQHFQTSAAHVCAAGMSSEAPPRASVDGTGTVAIVSRLISGKTRVSELTPFGVY
jgi:hypothetical protein